LANIIFDLPFFKLEKAIPFEIEPDDVELLTNLYRQILLEYRTDNDDKFEMIASYTHTLLMYVRRLYFKYVATDKNLLGHIQQSDNSLVERFLALIRNAIREKEVDKRMLNVKFFASRLSTHPNHLNALVKRKTQKTAIEFIHEQIIHEAKSLLSQTRLSVKEISFRVGYTDAAHFTNFFKKNTGTTPVLYRKGMIL
jgi:AraC-like DNA-binding protein